MVCAGAATARAVPALQEPGVGPAAARVRREGEVQGRVEEAIESSYYAAHSPWQPGFRFLKAASLWNVEGSAGDG
jgi:hypothetical protein